MTIPRVNEHVIFRVQEITEFGVFVYLPEYPTAIAMIKTNTSKTSKGRKGMWYVGKYGIAKTDTVDDAKRYVELSNVSNEPNDVDEEMREKLRLARSM